MIGIIYTLKREILTNIGNYIHENSNIILSNLHGFAAFFYILYQ